MHSVGQILLVCKHKQERVLHFAVSDDAVEFLAGLVDSCAVGRVHYEYQTLSSRKVVTPEGTNLFLSTHVPDVEANVFVGQSLDIEADSGHGGDSRARRCVLVWGFVGGVDVVDKWKRETKKKSKIKRTLYYSPLVQLQFVENG